MSTSSDPASTPSSPSRWRRPVMVALGVVVLAGVGYAGWRHWHPGGQQTAQSGQGGGQQSGGPGGTDGKAGTAKPVPVTVAKAEQGDFPVWLPGLGTVQAFNTVTVRAQVSGEIQSIGFKEGQLVKQGDLLVEIDPRPLQASLEQARAKLAQDQSSLNDANTNLQRYGQLAQQQFVSRQQLDTQASTVNGLKASIKGDQAAIDNAETQLGYASIRAPISGRVGFRLVDRGNVVSPSDTSGIVTIQQVSPIAVVFTAAEEQLAAIIKAVGAGRPPVQALSSDGTRTLAAGTLGPVNNEVDTASGTVRLKARFDNADGALWPGLSVSTRLLIDTLKGVVKVPSDAVQHGPDGLFVYVVGDDNKAAIRKIEVSQNDGDTSVVSKGLKAGDSVVTEGQYRVQPDTVVDPKPAKQPAQGSQGAEAQAGKAGSGASDATKEASADKARRTAQE